MLLLVTDTCFLPGSSQGEQLHLSQTQLLPVALEEPLTGSEASTLLKAFLTKAGSHNF